MKVKKKVYEKGFTLVELLVYMGVLAVFLGVLSTLFGAILDVQLDSTSTSVVDQDSRYIQSRLTYDMQRATSITSPASGASSSSLQIKVGATNYTYSVSGNNLQLNDGSSTYVLNSSDTTVSGLNFTGVGSGSNSATIRVNYTVTSSINEVNSTNETRTVQTTLSMQ